MSEIIRIVLDAEEWADGVRVYIQGAFTDGVTAPQLKPGRQRNVMRVFLNKDMRDVSAFFIGFPSTEAGS